MDEQLKQRLDLAVLAAREAGDLTLKYFQSTSLKVERKSDDSPVTIADREAELLLRKKISSEFPNDAILGEEFPEKEGISGYQWIVDPIDGTKSFISGVPLYSTLVGVLHESQPKIGVICLPALGQCVYAATGSGAWHKSGQQSPRPAAVSNTTKLAESLFVTTEVRSFQQQNRRAAYDRLNETARLSRTWGDGYGYFLVATGQADVMVDPIMNVWDAAALAPVMEEAGGTFTDWQGRATIHSGEGIATNGRLIEEILAITRDDSTCETSISNEDSG